MVLNVLGGNLLLSVPETADTGVDLDPCWRESVLTAARGVAVGFMVWAGLRLAADRPFSVTFCRWWSRRLALALQTVGVRLVSLADLGNRKY